MAALRIWLSLPWRERALTGEAFVLIALASLAIRLLPFRRVAAAAARPGRAMPPREAIQRIRLAVRRAAKYSPWRALCFEQGLAAQAMLRRRGYRAALHYGARRDEAGKLAAHVWVRAGERDVIGCENAETFARIATFGDA